jgi:hypothetical protein
MARFTTKQYTNIPSTGYSSTNIEETKQRRWFSFREKATFTFSLFSIMQFVAGVELYVKDMTTVRKEVVALMSKLFKYGLENQVQTQTSDHEGLPIEFSRDEVKLLVTFLLSRMAHCEKERDLRMMKQVNEDTEISCFNSDTYIGQKLLLLELKEWLLGEEVEASIAHTELLQKEDDSIIKTQLYNMQS